MYDHSSGAHESNHTRIVTCRQQKLPLFARSQPPANMLAGWRATSREDAASVVRFDAAVEAAS